MITKTCIQKSGRCHIMHRGKFDSTAASNGQQPANPHTYLQGATTFFYYDLDAWNDRAEPVQAISVVRETFESDLAENQVTTCQIKLTYSDGMGREIQSKVRVDDGMAWNNNNGVFTEVDTVTYSEGTLDRWLVTGRTVFNNKQKPVKQYEPFYSTSHRYEPEQFFATHGVTPVIHYDPLLRVVRTDSPKGFFSKVTFSPWEIWSYDFNDTVEDSDYWGDNFESTAPEMAGEIYALEEAQKHYDTPKVTLLDSMGHEYVSLDILRTFETDTSTSPPTITTIDNWLVTTTVYDVTGKPMTVTDPRQDNLNAARTAPLRNFRYTHDMTGAVIRTQSLDAGDRRVLNNVMGNPVRTLDSNGNCVAIAYDVLQRPVSKTVTGNGLDNVVELMIYGESVTDAADFNLRGRLYMQYDSSGRVAISLYDILQKPCLTVRNIRAGYETEADWPDTEAGREALLDATDYETEAWYDALGRVTLQKQPDGLDGTTPTEVVPQYLPTGWLKAVNVKMRNQSTPTAFVSSITYNPKGQREQITYGNGTKTEYTYEDTTFRLTGMLTKVTATNDVQQDIKYLYDPVGNILKIEDTSHKEVINDSIDVEPVCTYSYDSLYRLISATGRQHNALLANHDVAGAFKQSAHLNNYLDLSIYTQTYQYDDSGNLTRLVNAVPNNSAASYTRYIDVHDDSNRALQRPDQGQTDFTGKFDANGNQVVFEHLTCVAWDFRNNLSRAVVIDRTSDVDDAEYYVYDAAGQRVRKVTHKLTYADTSYDVEDKIYLGNVEVKKITRMVKVDGVYVPSPDYDMHRTSMHVMDDKNRIAIAHFWHIDDDEREVETANLDTNKVRYQYGNHLGSASLELDATANVISYEEYFPYGGTSFMYGPNQTDVKLKEYRYSAKERDDTTSFYYYGARYYAPWLCRWCSPDPAGPVDGPNLYWFVRGNPVKYEDAQGRTANQLVPMSIPTREEEIRSAFDDRSPMRLDVVAKTWQDSNAPEEVLSLIDNKLSETEKGLIKNVSLSLRDQNSPYTDMTGKTTSQPAATVRLGEFRMEWNKDGTKRFIELWATNLSGDGNLDPDGKLTVFHEIGHALLWSGEKTMTKTPSMLKEFRKLIAGDLKAKEKLNGTPEMREKLLNLVPRTKRIEGLFNKYSGDKLVDELFAESYAMWKIDPSSVSSELKDFFTKKFGSEDATPGGQDAPQPVTKQNEVIQ